MEGGDFLMQITGIRNTHPGGEEQVAILVFCNNCFLQSQVRLGGEKVVFFQGHSDWLIGFRDKGVS